MLLKNWESIYLDTSKVVIEYNFPENTQEKLYENDFKQGCFSLF